MTLRNSVEQNSRVMRMFSAEKGIDVAKIAFELLKRQKRHGAHRKRRRSAQMPALINGTRQISSDGILACGACISLTARLHHCFVDGGDYAGQPLNPEYKNLRAWFKRIDARHSAKA